tara:strand:- start:5 stop:2194 length:2190 start_codon:yes stop_codon:yes gene_type:complete
MSRTLPGLPRPVLTRDDPSGTPSADAATRAAAGAAERRSPPANHTAARFATFVPTTYDATARTVEVVLSTGAPVRRWSFTEELEISATAIDLARVIAGQCPLLDTHDDRRIDSILGRVVSVRIEGQDLIGLVSFADTDPGRKAEGMVARGELRGISIGYRVTAWTMITVDANDHETWRATSWELLEASWVPVPADAKAGVRSAAPVSGQSHETPGVPATPDEDEDMRRSLTLGGLAAAAFGAARAAFEPNTDAGGGAPAAPAAPAAASADPATRAAETPAASPAAPVSASPMVVRFSATDGVAFIDQARSLGVEDRARELMAQNERGEIGVETARSAVLTAAAERQRSETAPVAAGSAARVVVEDRDRVRSGVPAAILAGLRRSSGAPEFADTDAGRAARTAAEPYQRHSLSELAALSLGERTMPRTAAERIDLYARAFHTTSDFPILLSGALNSRLQENYQVATPVYRRIARQMTFMDFRAHDVLRPGDFPQLQGVSETGEIKQGTFGEKKETAYVRPYGIGFGLSRQLLVNDNLGAIDQILGSQGDQVALFEELTFFAMKGVSSGVGPVLNEDGLAVFHTTHANYTSSGTVINTANLGIGRAALRKQKNLSGQQMGHSAAILLVSPDKETEAEMALTAIIANDVAKANPFSGKLELVVGGQLTGNAWELYADPRYGTNWTWGLLDGFSAPRLRVEDQFGQQGVKVQLEHDFGVAAQDFRFGYRNAGA